MESTKPGAVLPTGATPVVPGSDETAQHASMTPATDIKISTQPTVEVSNHQVVEDHDSTTQQADRSEDETPKHTVQDTPQMDQQVIPQVDPHAAPDATMLDVPSVDRLKNEGLSQGSSNGETSQHDAIKNDAPENDTIRHNNSQIGPDLEGKAAEDPDVSRAEQVTVTSEDKNVTNPPAMAHELSQELSMAQKSFPAFASPANAFSTGPDFSSETCEMFNDEIKTILPSVELDLEVAPTAFTKMQSGERDASVCMGFERDNDSSLFIPETKPVPSRSHLANMSPPHRLLASHAEKPEEKLAFSHILQMQKKPRAAKTPKPLSYRASRALTSVHEPTPNCPDTSQIDPGAKLRSDIDELRKEDTAARKKFIQKKKAFDALKARNGFVTFQQDINWMKMQKAEAARQAKYNVDMKKLQDETRQDEDPDPFPELTFNEDNMDRIYGAGKHSTEQLLPDEGQEAPRKRRKQPEYKSMRQAEKAAMLVELEAEDDRPKKKAKKSNKTGSRKAPQSSKAAKKKSKPLGAATSLAPTSTSKKRTRKGPRQKREEQRQLMQAVSLMSTDVFADQAAEDAPDQPTFSAKSNKEQALKELVASVLPENRGEAQADKLILLQATKDFNGRAHVKPSGNGLWTVKGMETPLKPYQITGTAFMRRRERGTEEPKGGLFADQMGLGKTVMMLANIVNGRPERGNPVRTTLIVASPALLTQWEREIKKHVGNDISFLKYSSGHRVHSSHQLDLLNQHDIILTTYHEVTRSYPKSKPPEELRTPKEKADWWSKIWESERGILHRIHFLRVVLDEAQAIKNHVGRTSIACRALMASHRWALSGTPVMNGTDELYAYFKFLGVPHTGNFQQFKRSYCGLGDRHKAQRLLLLLSKIMLRRTHKDMMFGSPILKLPRASQATYWCKFNIIEREIYAIVQQRFIETINTWVKSGKPNTWWSDVRVMLLRLRQLTAHVFMLQFVMRDLLHLEDIEKIRAITEKEYHCEDESNAGVIVAVRKQLDELADHQKKQQSSDQSQRHSVQRDKSENVDVEEQQTARAASGNSFGKRFDFDPMLSTLQSGESWQQAKATAKCCLCGQGPRGLWLPGCSHLLCQACYEDALVDTAQEQGNTSVQCHICKTTFNWARQLSDPTPQDKSPGPRKEKDEDLQEEWLTLYGDNVLPSAKTIAFKAQVLNWIQENPHVKIIVYTQFLPMVRILAKVCEEEGWSAEEYHGKLSHKARDEALCNFSDERMGITVLLASLKCGGVGLNLTMASRVLMIDPWWNNAVEQQAFCRVFRIGQESTTFMTRFCVKDTVDERLMNTQERKQEEIDDIMEDDGTRLKGLSHMDILRLFGSVVEDSSGAKLVKPYTPEDEE